MGTITKAKRPIGREAFVREVRPKEISYCAAVMHFPGGANQLLASQGRVIVFDTLAYAREVLHLFDQRRILYWSADGETATWSPIELDTFNKVSLICNYDVYNLPAGHPVPSESAVCEWKRHVMFSQAHISDGELYKQYQKRSALEEEVMEEEKWL